MTKRDHSILPALPTALTAAILVLAAISLASCNNAFGVFHEIQTEKEQEGTDTFYETNVKTITEDSTNYYAAMAKLFYRPVSGSAGDVWSLLKVNGMEDYYCSGVAADSSGTLYVASAKATDGTLYGIYSTSDSGSTWTNLISDTAAIASKYVDALFVANDTLFASTHTINTESLVGENYYDLYYYDTGTQAFVLAGSTMTEMSSCISDVAWDNSIYWAINKNGAFKGALGSMAADTTSGTPVSSSDRLLEGLTVDSDNAVRISTYDDYLFTLASGGSAWSSTAISESGSYSSSIHLGKLIEVENGPSADTKPRLVIANNYTPYGYYEYASDASGTAILGSKGFLAGSSSVYNSTIKYKPVISYYLSKDGETLFIGLAAHSTESYGLYSTTFSSSDDAWSGWTAE